MIDKLQEALKILPRLLKDPSNFQSLIINRRKPHTYRVFTDLGNDLRLCLHKFNVCDQHEAFLHPHPWPGAFKILKGSYKMNVGYSKSRTEKPEDVLTLILPTDSYYEITNPLTTTYTVMINGKPWDADYAHTDIRTTKGKDLESMNKEDLQKHLDIFKELLNEVG